MSSIRVDFTNITEIREEIIDRAKATGLLDEKGNYQDPRLGDSEQKVPERRLQYLHTLLKLDLTPVTTRAEQLIDHCSNLSQLQRILDPVYFFAPLKRWASTCDAKAANILEKKKQERVEEYKTQYLGRTVSDDKVAGYNRQRDKEFKKIQNARKKWGVKEIIHCIRDPRQAEKCAAEKYAVEEFQASCEEMHAKNRSAELTQDQQLLEDVLNLIKYVDTFNQLQRRFEKSLATSGERDEVFKIPENLMQNTWHAVGHDLETFVLHLELINNQITKLETTLSAQLKQTVPAIEPAAVTLNDVGVWQEQLSAWLKQLIDGHAIGMTFLQHLLSIVLPLPGPTFEEWLQRSSCHINDQRTEEFAKVLYEQFKLMLQYQSRRDVPASADIAKTLEDSKRVVRKAELEMRHRNLIMVQPSPLAVALPAQSSLAQSVLNALHKHRKKILFIGICVGIAILSVVTSGAALGGIGIAFAAFMGSSTATAGAVTFGAILTSCVGIAGGLIAYKHKRAIKNCWKKLVRACASRQDEETIDASESSYDSLSTSRSRFSSTSTVMQYVTTGCNPFNSFYRGKVAPDKTAQSPADEKCFSSPISRSVSLADEKCFSSRINRSVSFAESASAMRSAPSHTQRRSAG